MFTAQLLLMLKDHMLFTGFGNAWFDVTEMLLGTCYPFNVLDEVIVRYNSPIYYKGFCIYYDKTHKYWEFNQTSH